MAKYEACIAGLKAATDMNIENLKVYCDSILIISEVTGEREVKSPK